VVAATTALWFTVSINGWRAIIPAAFIMGIAVCGMHYTAMAAMRVRLREDGNGAVAGISPFLLIVPITLVTSAALIALTLNALQAMTEEEFALSPAPSSPLPPPSPSPLTSSFAPSPLTSSIKELSLWFDHGSTTKSP
jgi:hypothetical protein